MENEETPKVKKKDEVKNSFELVEVPTQTTIVYRQVGSDNVFDEKQVLLQILNDLALLKKGLL